jgi:hypothetical protein
MNTETINTAIGVVRTSSKETGGNQKFFTSERNEKIMTAFVKEVVKHFLYKVKFSPLQALEALRVVRG